MNLQMPAEKSPVDRQITDNFNTPKIKFINFSYKPALSFLEVHGITIYTAILAKKIP